ncbi:MAG: NAD(P)-binding domain-containing protein, partial [Oscillospiraceae bacterium]
LSQMGVTPAGKRIVLLGAGGAAKSVALALCEGGAAHITVCNRTPERARALASCNNIMSTETMEPAALKRAVSHCDLLVNCTSLGMAGGGGQFESLDFLEALPEGAPVCDLIYHPLETALLSAAGALGHPTMNGLPLLLNQAILSLEHFLDRELDGEKLLKLLYTEVD